MKRPKNKPDQSSSPKKPNRPDRKETRHGAGAGNLQADSAWQDKATGEQKQAFFSQLARLRGGRSIQKPVYDFHTHARAAARHRPYLS